MGQQQLLLIVLGVIIVGVAIVVGINLFNANAEQSAKDTVIAEATNIAALAQQHYKKPTAMGGGNNSFTGFAIPAALATTSTATYTWNNGVITGTPVASLNYTWVVTTTVTATSITSVVGT